MDFALRDRHLRGPHRLITPAQMYMADAAAIAAGTPGVELMENAGRAIVREILLRWSCRPVLVMCGPGNNGGDGFVVARLLRAEGWPVRVALLIDAGKLKGDARQAAQAWDGTVERLTPAALGEARLLVDGLFGAGLARPLDGIAGEIVRAVNENSWPVVAVDIPSGIDGETGQVRGEAVAAALTVTFARRKPGHLLMPGRKLCGETVCAAIGIGDADIPAAAPHVFANDSALWGAMFEPVPSQAHKYHKGHAVVVSGGLENTGAARLAAMAALRTGAGLVTVASPKSALTGNAAHLTSIMLQPAEDAAALSAVLADRRKNAVAIGPAAGIGGATRAKVRAVLASGAACVLDADALTSFADAPRELFAAICEDPQRPVVLTPHEGEFARLFGDLSRQSDSKWQRAAAAAEASGAIVVVKGADTVIAGADGILINANGPPDLATAGSGDVLTGIIAGLLARRIPPLAAAAAGVWLHGAAGRFAGAGLIAEDLPQFLPRALAAF